MKNSQCDRKLRYRLKKDGSPPKGSTQVPDALSAEVHQGQGDARSESCYSFSEILSFPAAYFTLKYAKSMASLIGVQFMVLDCVLKVSDLPHISGVYCVDSPKEYDVFVVLCTTRTVRNSIFLQNTENRTVGNLHSFSDNGYFNL